MSNGPNNSSTQTSGPPAYLQPYLQQFAGQAENLYGKGYPVVPFAPQTETALQGIQNRALSGSPVTNTAQSYVTNSLNGDYLNSNPYLDQTFNRAALQTQDQLASEFAGAGRNVGASEGLRSQQLNDLATQIYGGNYANERALQQGTLSQAIPLANQDYTDLGQLANVGQQVQQQAGQYAMAPYNNMDQFGKYLFGGNYGNTGTINSQQGGNTLGTVIGGGLLASQAFPGLMSGVGNGLETALLSLGGY